MRKQKMRFKGPLMHYLRLPCYLFVLLVFVDILLYLLDFRAGLILSLALIVYMGVSLTVYFRGRGQVKEGLTAYAIQYETVVKETLKQLDIPYAIMNKDGTMVWANDVFARLTHRLPFDTKNIHSVFPDFDLSRLEAYANKEESTPLEYEDHIYRIWVHRIDLTGLVDDSSVAEREKSGSQPAFLSGRSEESILYGVYLYDETALRQCQKKLEDERMVVALIYLDNYEEALESVEEVRRALLIALVDRKLNKFFADIDVVVRKTEKDKYFLVMKNTSLEKLRSLKFQVLEDVRSINIGNSAPVTLSIGVGAGGCSYKQNNEYARRAIEMALGRGGDQAVIKDGDSYSYWGGKTLSPEKSTRVKARMKAQALKEYMSAHEKVVVMGHKITDVDALGAAIGIYRAGQTIDKPVHIVVNDPTTSIRPLMESFLDNPEYQPDMFLDSAQAKSMVDDNTVVVVVDTNKPSYTECEELLHLAKTVVVLDHHRRGDSVVENAVLSYVEPYASSTCEMVAEILQYFSEDLRLRSSEADCLYAGIVIDTNNFTSRSGVRTFEAAAYLRRNGADITRVRKMLRDNIDSYKAKAEAVRTAEIYRDFFAIAVCPSEGLESPTVVGAQVANELLNVAGVKASFVLTSYHQEVYVSARAIDEVNVQVLMEQMGGGGHLNVAGAQIKTSIEEGKERVKAIIDNFMEEGGLK